EEVFRVSAQVDTPPTRRSNGVPVQTSKDRVFDHLDPCNVIPIEVCEGDTNGVWQRCTPSHMLFQCRHFPVQVLSVEYDSSTFTQIWRNDHETATAPDDINDCGRSAGRAS